MINWFHLVDGENSFISGPFMSGCDKNEMDCWMGLPIQWQKLSCVLDVIVGNGQVHQFKWTPIDTDVLIAEIKNNKEYGFDEATIEILINKIRELSLIGQK